MFFRAFTRLFRRDKEPVLPGADLLRDLGRIETFPTLSDTALRAMALTNDPTASTDDLVDLIRRDGVLTVALLKLANSAAYGGRHPTENVHRAVVRLGQRGCRQVLAAVAARGVFRHPAPEGARVCDGLLRHALFTGTLASKLSATGGLGFRGEEFTAGLLHDIGRVILCTRAPAAFPAIDPMTFDEGPDVLANERAVLSIDHCEIGARFARVNHLPGGVIAAVLNHHFPSAEQEYRLLVVLTAVADVLANHVQRERKLTNFDPNDEPAFAVFRRCAGEAAWNDIRADLSNTVVVALRETRAMLRAVAN